jgi:hypothetical protein
MPRAILVLVLLSAALFAWNRALDAGDVTSRAEDPKIEPLVARETYASRTVAALTVENTSTGHAVLFARKRGRWLCREAFGASADETALNALLESLLQARGVVRTDDPARAASYGFDDALRVRLHGPKVMEAADRDVIAGVDIGASTGRTAFVRLESTSRIFEIDRDPRAHLETRAGTSLPPLIDTRLLAGSTGEGFRGFERFVFTFADGRTFAVESERGADPDALPEWFVVHGAKRDPCPSWRIGGYTGLWLREHFDGLANPARAEELGLVPPFLSIELYPHDREAIRFDVSAPSSDGTGHLWNRTTNTLSMIARDVHEMVLATPEMFLDGTRANPWERYLSK